MSSLGRRRYPSISISLSLLLLFAVTFLQSASAQTVNATLTGHVEDSQGATISGATVTVKNTGTGAVRTTITDPNGLYTVTNLQPGSYEVTTTMNGFSTKTLTGLTLNVGDTPELPISLTVGGVNDTVNVEAAEPLLQTQSSSNGTLVDNKQVVELPLANRQFYSLALLSPAAYQPAQNSTLGFRGGINIAGASEISNQFTFNGIFNNDMGVAQPSYRPSVETIQEFRLLTGVYPAEYGRMAGGQVVVISKSGTNAFHGSAYEFIRNEITDAKPYFTQAGAKKPSYKQNTFGGTIGGPIWKDHTFFFFGYEGQRIRQAVTAVATVPTADMLNGVFNVGKTLYNPRTGTALAANCGTGCYNLTTLLSGTQRGQWGSTGAAAGQAIAKLGFPTPSLATALGSYPTNNYNFQETRSENMDEYTIRVDHKLTEKDGLSGSFNIFKDPAFEPSNSLCSSYVVPKFGCYTNQISTLINLTYTRILTPSLLNEFRAGYQRLQQPRIQEDNTAIGSSYSGLPGGPYFTQAGYANNSGLPNTAISGFATIGGATNLPQNRWDSHYQIVDAISWTHGKHTVKAGIDLLLARSINLLTSSGRGAFSVNDANIVSANGGSHLGSVGDSMADLLLGLSYTSTIGTTAPVVYLNFFGNHVFVQDDYRITPKLTLNVGLRWEMDTPVYTPNGTVSRFDIASQTFTDSRNGAFKHLYNYDWNNWAPRLGFSWQPFSGDKTVVKGAFGAFYNTPLLYNQFLNFGTQYPYRIIGTSTSTSSTASSINTISLDAPFAGAATSCATGTQTSCSPSLSPLSVNANYRTPYINEWSFGLQQSFAKSMVFETTYFGSKGTKLPLSINLNQINVNNLAQGATTTQTMRPFANFSTVSSQDTRSNSEFHSWQNSLKQSYANGVTFILSYTWGKSIDGGGGIGSGSTSSGAPQNIYNLRAERAVSDFNVAHRLVFSPVAQLPFGKGKKWLNSGVSGAIAGGWQVSGIFQFQTGRPFTITNSSTNNSRSFGNADRPNIVAGQDPNAGPKTVAQWFNTAAFSLAPTTRFGNAGRNIVVGPKFTQLDLTLSREFPILEHLRGQFRAESFNLLNHPNFFNPLTTGLQFGATGFGALTQAYTPRDLQFSLRILY
ncbi:TonB-dependent receptor [Terriglobus albidus]|uniref:TonB-dependent receptor n=1 Tax=Terriglobus albidus TaxID=1592106 RepID=A0A5B9EEA4_9BACT|nr:TonB-dependent receptor [Terriglobus albidus]QEE29120.1 TonB-dependent receptor [Terriglobus albidus]